MKKVLVIFLLLTIFSSFLPGCKGTGGDEFVYFDNETYFRDLGGTNGVELWFNRWHLDISSVGNGNPMGNDTPFVLDGKVYEHGLGIDGITIEGRDPRELSFIKYKILQGEFSEVRAILGFDDSTKVKAECKLTAYADDKKIYESPSINSDVNSVNIAFKLPKNIETISFRFDFHTVNGVTPRIILVDLKAKKR